MSLRSRIALTPRAVLVCRILGFSIFAFAFFLPACRDHSPVFGSTDVYPGWKCAQVTIAAMVSIETYQSWDFLAALSGLINPLILAYLAFLYVPRSVLPRRILAAAVLLCMAATWIFFLLAGLVPLIGHFLWIAGALMILLPEVTVPRPAQLAD
jgi:hypothetical protein